MIADQECLKENFGLMKNFIRNVPFEEKDEIILKLSALHCLHLHNSHK